jgi:hypothetical protein
MDDNEIRRIIIRGHQKVISHCRFLLASPNLQEVERETLQVRLAIEERALNILSGGASKLRHQQVA